MVDNPCGIPQAMRDRAEENMRQTHAAARFAVHKPLKELFALEKQFAQDRFQALVTHTQEIYGLIAEKSSETANALNLLAVVACKSFQPQK